MGKLSTAQKCLGFELRRRLGKPSSFGRAHCGFNILGADDSLFGIYQKATFADGRAISIRPFYWPSNPQTTSQQLTRSKFSDAMGAWGALTTPEKLVYSKRASPLRLYGHHLFIKEYMRSH